MPGRWNGREMGIMLRLAATGSDAQINQCLKALRDKEKTGKLAAVVEWRETHAYHEFLALPKHILHVWTDADAVYAAGKEATSALAEFLKQVLDFDIDEDGIFKVACPCAEQPALMARLIKLTSKWGFELGDGKPEWARD